MGEQPTHAGDILIRIKQACLVKCLKKTESTSSVITEAAWAQDFFFLNFTQATEVLPLSFQLSLVGPEPRVRHLLAATGEASPPADALPAGEAAPADGLAPLGASLGLRVPPGHAAGELLQGTTQRHDGIHHRGLFCANVRGRSRALLHHRTRHSF